MKPLSKALSCIEFKHNPLCGLVLFFLSIDQGTIWLATNKSGIDSPVKQHFKLYDDNIVLLKKL